MGGPPVQSKKKPARRHHTVPRFYLERFACAHRKGRLLVLDASTRKHFHAKPEDLTVERDFNRVDADGVEPDALEAALGEIESEFSHAVRRTVEGKNFASDEDKIVIANFAAVLMIRNPRFRSLMARLHEDVAKSVLRLQVANKDRWEKTQARMQADGYLDGRPAVNYDEYKEFVEKDEYDIRFPREYYIAHEMKLLQTIPQLVARRGWQVFVASASSGGFVCCDHPATLIWSDPEMWKSPYSPGLGLAGTHLLFPLSTTVAVAGAFELKDAVVNLNDLEVAAFNSATILGARRQVYCEGERVKYSMQNDAEPKRVMALLKDHRFRHEKLPDLPWY